MSPPNGPKIKTLRTIGETDAARMVAAIVQAVDPDDASKGMQHVAKLCLVDSWTVYRWVAGKHVPRRRQLDALQREAAAKGLTWEMAPQPVDAAVGSDANSM